MPFYENVLIARQDIPSTQVEQLAQNFSDIVQKSGGKVTKTEMWGLRTLAYKIKKNRKGHYVFMNIDAPAEAITELERNLRIHEDVLRFLTVRVDKLEDGPSVVLQSKNDRPSRRGDSDRSGFDFRDDNSSEEGDAA